MYNLKKELFEIVSKAKGCIIKVGIKHKKGKVAARRIWTGVKRIIILAFFLLFSALLSYYCIACTVKFIEDGKLPSILGWRNVFDWFETEAVERKGYIPAITVASASLMLSVITLLQSHFNREQDRVMNFPPNYLDEVEIGLDVMLNMDLARKFFDPVNSKNLIRLNFKRGFSAYYKFYPYRLFVCLSKESMGKGIEWEEIELYNFQYSCIKDNDPDSYEVLIEGSESCLLKEYCNKSDKNADIKLKFILDSRWTNNLTPLWERNFSDMYIREEFGLSFEKSVEEGDVENTTPFDKYKVLYSDYKKAPLASWGLLYKCVESKKETSKRCTRESENAKRLQERGY